jgi:hypothetical protein
MLMALSGNDDARRVASSRTARIEAVSAPYAPPWFEVTFAREGKAVTNENNMTTPKSKNQLGRGRFALIP